MKKKIVSMALYSDPRSQGGIPTFNRVLKNFYPQNLLMMTIANKREKIFKVLDIEEIGTINIFFRILNKLFKNLFRRKIVQKKLNKIKPDYIIFSFPSEILYTISYKTTKILVQHLNYEKYISNFCQENNKYVELIRNEINYFVALSEYDAEKFKKGLTLKDNQIRVIRHSSEVELLTTKKKKNKKLIMITRLDLIQKGLDLAIKVMKKLPEYTLEIYGSEYMGGEKEILENLIKKESLKNVFLNGRTSKIKEKLDEAAIFIMTSEFEGYPISTIEAMRRGLPIILRDTFDSAKDIVIDNGVLLEKEWNEDKFVDAVKEVYSNYEYYSENSRRMGERHSPEVIKKEWDKLLEME